MQLQEAYDVLMDSGSRELYNLRRDVWGFIPSAFLPRKPTPSILSWTELTLTPFPAAAKSNPEVESKPESKNTDIKEAFRKARLREKLEAARLRAEQEKREQDEAEQRIEQEKLQALAAERIRAAREALKEERRLEEERAQQARDQERLHRMASESIRAQRIAREEARVCEEARRRAEEIREIFEAEEAKMRENLEQRRRQEEFAEKLRQFGLKTPKGIAPNYWSEVEIDCLLQWKREGVTWVDIAQKMNEMFDNSRSATSCRRKYIKMERAGET